MKYLLPMLWALLGCAGDTSTAPAPCDPAGFCCVAGGGGTYLSCLSHDCSSCAEVWPCARCDDAGVCLGLVEMTGAELEICR